MEEEIHVDANGNYHSFPKGTDPEVIKKALRLSAGGQVPPEPKPQAAIPKGVGGSETAKTGVSNINKATGVMIDPVSLFSNAAGVGAGALTESPLAASGTSAAVDEFLRHYVTGEKDPDLGSTLADTAIGTAENEIGGRAIGLIPKVGNTLNNIIQDYRNPVDPLSILNLKPTTAQVLKSKGSPYAGITGIFEDLFSPSAKKAALDRSFNASMDEGDKFVNDLINANKVPAATATQVGQVHINLDEPNFLANKIKEGETGTFLALKQESNARGEAAKLIASANPQAVTRTELQPSKVLGPNGQPIMIPVTKVIGTVDGPIQYQKTIQLVQKLKQEMLSSNIKPDPENPVFRALNDIIEGTGAKFDKNGNLTSIDPVSFATAWKDKQIADTIGYGTAMSDVNIKDSRFIGISNALNEDINNSMSQWNVDGAKAQQLFNESKQIVAKRNLLMTPSTERGKSLDTLIDTVTKPTDTLNTIIDDPEKLKRALATGTVVIPNSGTATQTNLKYITNNAKQDLQGYQMMRMLNEAQSPSSIDASKLVFDPSKLTKAINDPNAQESLRTLYGSQTLSNIKQLFKNIELTTQKGTNVGASRYLALKLGIGGVTLGSGIATTLASGSLAGGVLSGGTVIGASLGAHYLAKLMTNPEAARVVLAMSQGAPLGMSTTLATRIISNAIRNSPITLQHTDGSETQGKLDKFGKFVIPFSLDLNNAKYPGGSQ